MLARERRKNPSCPGCKHTSCFNSNEEVSMITSESASDSMFADAVMLLKQRLSNYERQYCLDSRTFLDQYVSGKLKAHHDFEEWCNDYQHYIGLKIEMDRQFRETPG